MEQNLVNEQSDVKKEIIETFASGKELCKNLISDLDATVEAYQMNEKKSASEVFDEQLSVTQSLMAALYTLQMVAEKDLRLKNASRSQSGLWDETEMSFKLSLNAMLKAFGHEDFIGLADIIDDEFRASLQSWGNYIRKVETSYINGSV
ncbi:MAG: hypothetical protein AB8E15_07965 [Bdellovibrionales bacterium]